MLLSPSSPTIERLCCALDLPSAPQAVELAKQVAEHVGVLKVGLELFVHAGPSVLEPLQQLGRRIFLDLKLHDIPETVARAVAQAASWGVDYLTIHAAGGERMLRAAAEAAHGSPLRLLAVTVLTSLDDADLRATGVEGGAQAQVLRLAQLALNSGVSGLVCSVEELEPLRRHLGQTPVLVVPGIRPAGATSADQKRVGTPQQALQRGASLLVVGRPIRDAQDPAAAAARVLAEMA